jgi:hypothetical protein
VNDDELEAEASGELAKLQDRRARAAARVDALEADWRAAVTAAQEASAGLAHAERVGVSASKRSALEEELATAKARAAEPWAERVEGAKAAVRDADSAIREHVATHLPALVADEEAAGREVAAKINELALALVAAFSEREQIESSLGQLLVRAAGRVSPGDVTYSRAADVAVACRALLDSGGEAAVMVNRSHAPWDRLLESEAEAVAS